jgi:hypothetical protein
MRRYALALALILVVGTLAGCSSGDSEESAEEDTGVTYETLALDANAAVAAEFLPAYIEEYVQNAIEDGETEGVEYLDVTGIEPEFIGYEVVAWEEIEGSDEVEYVEVAYINGQIVAAYAKPETEMSSEPSIITYDRLNIREMPESPTEGEVAAVAAAKAKLAEFFPDLANTQYGIKRYLFLYEKDGQGVVVGMTADDALGSNSEVVDLKME